MYEILPPVIRAKIYPHIHAKRFSGLYVRERAHRREVAHKGMQTRVPIVGTKRVAHWEIYIEMY